MEPVIDHIEITVQDMDVAVPFYDRGLAPNSAAATCLAAFLVLSFVMPQLRLGDVSALARQSGQSSGSITSLISPVVEATWFTSSRDGIEQLELLVLWRGTPGWFMRAGGSTRGGSTGRGTTRTARISRGDLRLMVEFDTVRRVAVIQSQSVELRDQNVVFVDDVDSPTGPRVVKTLMIPRAMPGSAGQIGLVLQQSPEIVAFLRCDAKPANGRGTAFLSGLCLQQLGIVQ